MINAKPIFYCLFLSAFISFPALQAQQVFKATSKTVIGYLEYLPPDYRSNSNKYPVVIFLHGIGERGPVSTDLAVLSQGIGPIANLGPPMYVKYGHKFPFILISPQLKKNYGTWPQWYVDEVIEHVKTYLRIDESRIYVTGLSLGGGGAWSYAETYPHKVAALAPVCGGYNTPSKACNIAGSQVPVWAFHGDKDNIVNMSKTINMVNAIMNCTPTPTPVPRLTIYPGVTHNAWSKAYTTDHSVHNPNVYEWMMSFTNTVNGSNRIPSANAGPDITRTLPAGNVTITGTGTDQDGSIAAYSWTQVEGPSNATLTNASGATLTASNLVAGIYTFRLRVTDNKGDSNSDYVRLTIQSTPASNGPLTANAGPDKTITLPTNSVALNGSGNASGGSAVSYKWVKVAGGTASLSGITTKDLVASNLAQGTYTFRLTVTTTTGATKSDDAIVTVKPSAANVLPNVHPGPAQTVSGSSVTLTGTANDPDGTIVAYEWFQVSGPNTATLVNKHTISVTASGLVAGEYMFRLMVTDNSNGRRSGYVKVTVTNSNQLPAVYAGPARTITLPTNAVTLTGTAKDPDGAIISCEWSQVNGANTAKLTNKNTLSLTASNLISGEYTFRLTATDNSGGRKSCDVKVSVAGNQPPVVHPGPAQTITLPLNSVTLAGTASDPDGSVVALEWFQVSGPNAATLTNKKTLTLKVSNLIEGEYMFRLMATDNGNARWSGYVRVTVKAPALSSARGQSQVQSDITDSDSNNAFDLLETCHCQSDIFNERGDKIFSGRWSPDLFHEVFTRPGLYFFHVQVDDKRIKKGKVFVTK